MVAGDGWLVPFTNYQSLITKHQCTGWSVVDQLLLLLGDHDRGVAERVEGVAVLEAKVPLPDGLEEAGVGGLGWGGLLGRGLHPLRDQRGEDGGARPGGR